MEFYSNKLKMTSKHNSSNRRDKIDKINAENGIVHLKNLCFKIIRRCRKLWVDEKFCEKLNYMMHFMLSHPLLLLICTIIVAIFVIPIASLTIFIVINIAITFSSFMIIEVSLLTIGLTTLSCIMFFVVATIVVTAMSLIVSFYATYFSFMLVKNKVCSK